MENYTVQKGDTLNKIAQKFGYKTYKEAGLTAKSGNPDLIRPGETYSINPSATSPARDAYTASLVTTPSTPSANSGTSNVPTGTTTTTTTPTDPFSSYRKYLSDYQASLSEPDELTGARKSLASVSGQIDERDLAARREYEAKLDESGGTVAGAQQSAAMARRRSNSELADLAVRQSGAARTLEALSTGQTARQQFYKTQAELAKPFEVAGSYYDPVTGEIVPETLDKPEAFELSPGQARYAYNPKTGTYEQVASLAPLPKEPTKPTESEKKKPLIDDVNAAVSQLGQIVKMKGFKGVSPDDYNAMRAYLQAEYGYEGVAELDKALEVLGLSVDYSSQ